MVGTLSNSATPAKERRPRGRFPSMAKSVGGFLVVVVTTYLGLLAVTFFIGRVVPIDPVLAIVGDRASASTIA